MSKKHPDVVRQPISVRARTRRRLDEYLGVRFPRALNLIARAVWRLSPRSRLRRALLRRAIELALEATNRGDYEAAFGGLYDADCEIITPAQLVTVGVESRTHGREARRHLQTEWRADWGEFRFEPDELIDLGDRLLLVGRVKGSGLTSGAAFDNEWANLLIVSAGRVIREQPFFSHEEALEAVGLSK
jgi:ketosteroid isomerase-like protein